MSDRMTPAAHARPLGRVLAIRRGSMPAPTIEEQARRVIWDFLARRRMSVARKKVYLVSYPRSGNTLAREYFSILQGRSQLSIYDSDVVAATNAALTQALDGIEIIKSHEMPTDDAAMIYLLRDGRNATLSFLYMTYLFGGHRFSELAEVYDGVRHLDAEQGSWADHVANGLSQAERRPALFVRYEDLVREPAAALAKMTRFMNAEIPIEILDDCIHRHAASDTYAANPYNGYLYEPAPGSIYDILKRHRRDDYWRLIFDSRSRRYFHECGGTELLMRFGYESAPNWWKE
jgi:hypothetical protein